MPKATMLGTTEDSTPFDLPGEDDEDDEELSDEEVFWRDHQPWLLQCGYQLRPRYHPDWVPSWLGQKKRRDYFEDSIEGPGRVFDATRVADGSFVALKIVRQSAHPYELEIGRFFSSEPCVSDPRNHCVPIIDTLQLPEDTDRLVVIMPLLRPFDDPRFDTVGEGVEFFRQLFEGVHFMHDCHVAHRDLMCLNIMMDASPLFPVPYHPLKPEFKRDNSGLARALTRTLRPIKYYIIDFGISRKYSPENTNPLEDPIWGGDKTVPEFQSSNRAQNPFPTDIYYLGNFIRECFLQGSHFYSAKSGFDFMKPLVDDMVQEDPSKRPNMEQVVTRFDVLRGNLSNWQLRSRVILKNEHPISNFIRAIAHWWRRIRFMIWRTPPLPTPKADIGKVLTTEPAKNILKTSASHEPHLTPNRDLERGTDHLDT